jgi:hypothetical protein
MIFPNTVIRKTGQWWKWLLFQCLLIVAAFAMFAGQWFTNLRGLEAYGALLGLLAFGFAAFFIRCPACGARWFWQAISNRNQVKWGSLMQQESCPACRAAQPSVPPDVPAAASRRQGRG